MVRIKLPKKLNRQTVGLILFVLSLLNWGLMTVVNLHLVDLVFPSKEPRAIRSDTLRLDPTSENHTLMVRAVPEGKNISGRVTISNPIRPDFACFYIQTYDQYETKEATLWGPHLYASGEGVLDASGRNVSWNFSVTAPVGGDYYFVMSFGGNWIDTTVLEYRVMSLERPILAEYMEEGCTVAIAVIGLILLLAPRGH
jgi:hypothetical protein